MSGPLFKTPEDVVRSLGAVQAQDYGPAKWAVGMRTRNVTDADLDLALARGSILRTHVLRPTWHFVLPEDIRWMLELTAPRVHAFNAYYYRRLELDESVVKRSNAALSAALEGGNRLTRKELSAQLDRAGIEADGLRVGYMLMNAELAGVICSGGLNGKQQTYALLEERVSGGKSLTHDEALAELSLRYFTSHGPATVKDFKWWSSLTTAEIKRGLEILGSQLKREVIDGLTYWFSSARASRPPSPSVHLLQGLDEYIVGYSESKFLLNIADAHLPLPYEGVVFNQVIILDGQVAGHWKRTLSKGSVLIEAALYSGFDAAQEKALREAANRQGDFLGLEAEVVISRI